MCNINLKFKKLLVAIIIFCSLIVIISAIYFHYRYPIPLTLKKYFITNLYQLNSVRQSHLTSRLYRITGDAKFAQSDLFEAYRLADKVRYFSIHSNTNFKNQYGNNKLKHLSDSHRDIIIKSILKQKPEFFYYTTALNSIRRLQEFKLCSQFEKSLLLDIEKYNFKDILFNRELLKVHSAQLANYTYWLADLTAIDLTSEFLTAFKKHVLTNELDNLSNLELQNLIYGLTHIIINQSNYYQKHVSFNKNKWIYDFFNQHIDFIINKTKPDIIAEVGISFILAKQINHPVVKKTKAAIQSAYSYKFEAIPAKDGTINIEKAEHRNILAVMLFQMGEKLYPGPHLSEITATKDQLPYDFYGCYK